MSMDLEIKWNSGKMIVHVEEFLDCHNISKFRKLIRLIEQSCTPDALDKLKGYILNEIEQFEPQAKEHANKYFNAADKVKFYQQQVENIISNMGQFRKNTAGWKHYNELMKKEKKELSSQKSLVTKYKNLALKCKKNKEFYSKCLEIIS
jgi:hypothetical protein